MSNGQIVLDYVPNSWQQKYHGSNARHCLLVGGMGSGKTTSAIYEHITLALEYPGSVWLVGRKTLPSLRDTILKAFLNACPQELIESYNKASLTLKLINGSEFLFRPLDDPEKLKSMEISGFIIEEANEVDDLIYRRLKDRTRQKLKDGSLPRYRSTIIINPTDEDHWIPQLFLFAKPENHEMFVSTTFDNMQNLPDDYVDELQNTYSKDVLQRFLYGQFGKIHKGRPVFPSFSTNSHVMKFEYDPTQPIIRGWDFGYNHPAVVWAQVKNEQIRVLNENMGKKIYLDDFLKGRADPFFEGVLNVEERMFGPLARYRDFCDPRGSDASDKGKTSIDILNEYGIHPIFRRTWIEEGVQAIKGCLDRINPATGAPNLIIHPRCQVLIDGFRGGYHREELSESPEKDGFYEHPFDALRYIVVHLVLRAKADKLTRTWNKNTNVYVSRHTGRRIEY